MSDTLFGAASGAANIAGGAIGGVAGTAVAMGAKNVLGAAAGMLGLFGGRRDPDVQFNYMVEIDGLALGMFTEVSGIKWSMQIDEINQGGENNHQRHLLGRAKFDPLVLKRGFVAKESLLYDMMAQTFDPNIPIVRKIVHVIVMKRGSNGGLGGMLGMNEVGRLSFYKCFVQEWSGPGFNTKQNEMAIESITFRYDWLSFHPGGALDQLLHAGAGAAMGAIGGALAGKSMSF